MLGTEGAVNLVVARLQAQMPAKITEVAGRYPDAATVALRPPALYALSLYERIELSQYPAVEVTSRDDGPTVFDDQTSGVFQLAVPYNLRLFLTERGNTFQQVEARRRRLTLALREVLFSTPLLQDPPNQSWILRESIRSSYFGISQIDEKDARSIAATYTDVTVMIQEMTELFPAANVPVADSVFVAVHPATRS